MKIAHLMPSSITFPLQKPNGRYTWALDLARAQANAGHDVHIFAGQDSTDTSSIHWQSRPPTSNHPLENNSALMASALIDTSFDIYHSHFDNLQYSLGYLTNKPIVFTQHWWPYEQTVTAASRYPNTNIWAAPPTRFMYDFDTQNNIQSQGHIYHGIDLSLFHHEPVPKSERLLFVGRISPEKNLALCIEIAKESGIGLDIIGKITPKNMSYWESLLPSIDGNQIIYHGAKTRSELIRYYSAARAVLFPTDTHEAFGLVTIEAQACGTPVITGRGGSRNELIDAGVTGFLCESITEYIDAIHASTHIRTDACRKFAEKFDIRFMVDAYESLYESLVG